MSDSSEILKAMIEAGIETDGQRLEREKHERLLKRSKKDELQKKHKHNSWIQRKTKRLTKNRAARRANAILVN